MKAEARSVLLRLRHRLTRRLSRGSAFFGREQRHQNVAFHARHGFDLALIANFHQQAIHFRATHFLVSHFAATMKNHGANFVAFAKKANDLILAHLVIVLGGGRPEFYFFQLRAAAAFALLVGFLVSLVKIFSVIGDFANGRIGSGRNFHQVQPFFLGHFYSFKWLHDAELAALFIDHPNFTSPDALVYANAVALPEAAFCDVSP